MDDIERLLESGEIQYKSGRVGCCIRYFLIFPDDEHKYYYKPNKLISNSLMKKVFKYLYSPTNSMNKSSNKKTKDNNDKNIRTIQKWIKKNSRNFKQENHDIQIIYEVTTKNNDDGKIIIKQYNTDAFKVFGGKIKIRKAIQAKTDETRKYFEEQYDIELIDIKIKRLYIDNIKLNPTEFKDIKMFGTLLNLCGYDLIVGNYEFINACCLEYHVQMFNKFRNNKWNIERLMNELNMKTIDEGVSLNQLIPLYIKYKIGYHVVDFKYHLTASHNEHNYKPTGNYPCLFYMIENNHLYPIVNKQHQNSISQIKDIARNKIFKPKSEKPQERTVHIFHRPDEILTLINNKEIERYNGDMFVSTTPTVVNELFYLLLKKNLLYNKNVRTDNARIIQFDINNITIQENTDYREVVSTIETLNKNISIEDDKYIYHGQTIHRLAHEYYERNFSKNYISEMSPQVSNVFNDKLAKNTAFNITLKDIQATTAYDFNKLYASILRFCGDKFGWCYYLPIDSIEPYDQNIKTGFYYIETDNVMPCHGNGWYADIFVCDALKLNIITHDDIKYQIKSSRMLSPRFFEDFVNAIVKYFNKYKQANNGFIGILAKNYNTYEKHYFTQDRMTALKEWLKKPDEVSYCGIYDNSKDLHTYQFLMNRDNLQAMIDLARSKEFEPMVWMVNISKKTPLFNNTLPIHRKIYDIANMMVYKKHLYIMSLNPYAELVRVKTDLLGYINIDNEIKTDDYKWGEVKREWLPPKAGKICDMSKLTRTTKYEHNIKAWFEHKRKELDNDDIQAIIKHGGLLDGEGGSGKSQTLGKIKEALPPNSFITGAFTHIASENVDGDTLHSICGIDVKTKKIDYKLVKSYIKQGIKHLIIDEISMIPSWIWNILAHMKYEYGFIIIGAGDWGQLPAVKEEYIDFENSWIVKYVFDYHLYRLIYVWRTEDEELLKDTRAIRNGGTIDYSTYTAQEYPTALCHSNDAVDAINKTWNEYYAKQHTKTQIVNGFDNTKYILYQGLKMLSYKTHGQRLFKNSQQFILEEWNDNILILKQTKGKNTGRIIEIDIKYSVSFKPGYAMTVHKSQGQTIRENYSIYEYEDMTQKMLYVAMTRATKKLHINFCKIDKYKPHTGYIYSYEYNGTRCIGSTNNLKKLKDAGINKFKIEETLKYSNIRALWELADNYDLKKYNY